MPDWVETNNPYQQVGLVELRTGTVLRRVPFPVMLLGETRLGVSKDSGKANVVGLSNTPSGIEVARADKAVVSPGVVLTPDCDIFQHKVNRIVVAQLVSVESHINNIGLRNNKAVEFRQSIQRAREANPGAFNRPGLFPMLADSRFGFEDHVVLLDNVISVPVQFLAEQSSGMMVTGQSVCGLENIWFRISHPELRSRLINEYSRHMLRVGLQDAE